MLTGMSLLKVGNKNGRELRYLNTLCIYGIKIVIYCINYRMKSTYLFIQLLCEPLRKHAYSNILKILLSKIENFQIKNSDIFHISAQNIDCGYSLEPPRRGGSKSTHDLCFLAEIRKRMYTHTNPIFTI